MFFDSYFSGYAYRVPDQAVTKQNQQLKALIYNKPFDSSNDMFSDYFSVIGFILFEYYNLILNQKGKGFILVKNH